MGIDWSHIDLFRTSGLVTAVIGALFMVGKAAKYLFSRPLMAFFDHVIDTLATHGRALDRIEALKIDSHGRIEANQETIRRRFDEYANKEDQDRIELLNRMDLISKKADSAASSATLAAETVFKKAETIVSSLSDTVVDSVKTLSEQIAKTNTEANKTRALILDRVEHTNGTVLEHGIRVDKIENVVFKGTPIKVKRGLKRR